MTTLPFIKMHGLGNDFAIFDGRERPIRFTPAQLRALADRRRGIGCDQVLILEPSARGDVFMRILNPDGTEAEACGNASRCAVRLVGAVPGRPFVLETLAGLLPATIDGAEVEVDMGAVRTAWHEIPIATAQDTVRVDFELGPLNGPACCSVGNPHATFFVADADAIDVRGLGPLVERHPFFPERVNVGFATVLGPRDLRLRMWERGVGETPACGSGACAAVVNAVRRGFTERAVTVHLDGGPLAIHWRPADDHVLMRGPTTHVFEGTIDVDALGGEC